MKEVIVTKENIQSEVFESKGLCLVDFWATWCGPCMMLGPILEEIAEEGKVKVCKVNVDENGELAQLFNVNAIPMLVLYQDGKAVKTHIGFGTKEEIEKLWK